MKLRKALEKARDEREKLTDQNLSFAKSPTEELEDMAAEDTPPDNSHALSGTTKNESLMAADISKEFHIIKPVHDDAKDAKDELWKKPTYSSSQIYKIDPDVVAANRGVCIKPNSDEIQRYKILKTRIQQQPQFKSLNTIMITSPNKKEGKTVNAINMAFTFARGMNQTVLLVDCDFTGQDIHRYLGIQSSFSLIDYFMEGTPLNELIIWPGIDKLTLISGNRTVLDGSELLSSRAMEELILEMKNRYDDRYILFDAPPVLEHAEALSMAPMMDGIIMVVEAGVTPEKDVKKALSMLPKEKIVGLLLNKRA
ncbi:MAG: AAA family ATPase [Desulfamplus sp.]|nr:AAA family ATPase [Desulfamplus sp.]